jgi:hypothetical protein
LISRRKDKRVLPRDGEAAGCLRAETEGEVLFKALSRDRYATDAS